MCPKHCVLSCVATFSELILAWEGVGGRKREKERERGRTLSLSPCNDCPDSETRPHQDFKRFLATPTQPTSTGGTSSSFKFVTECFFITQRALHVGLLPAVNTHTHVASELHKQTQAKIPGRNEEMLKQLSAVSWLVERGGRGERGERDALKLKKSAPSYYV